MKTINIFQVIKNRSKVNAPCGDLFLYPNCVDSIIESTKHSDFKYKIYVCDFNSDDYPLSDWLPAKLYGLLDYEIIKVTSDFFDKGKALNISREIFSEDDFIFYLDVDMLITKQVVDILESRFSIEKSVGFFASIFLDERGEGKRVIEGVGNFWIRHQDLMNISPWINMSCWGGEDTIFLYNCIKSGLKIYRETNADFYHQWHPIELRNKYYKGGKPPKDDYSQAIRDYYKTGVLREVKGETIK
jgi:hypothetical protein